tara:strand:- start:1973 stop:2272 length:300 start_codon:yes stop_codon:yes gene_type:complete
MDIIKKFLKNFFIVWGFLTIFAYIFIILIFLFITIDWLINRKTHESFSKHCWGFICPLEFGLMPIPRSWEKKANRELNDIKSEQKKYKAKALKKGWTTK